MDYKDGSKRTPVKVFDNSEAFDVCRERNRPTWVDVQETKEVFLAFPSGYSKSK